MDQAKQEAWAERVGRWTESGLTAEKFAAEEGVNPRSLTWWRWRLRAKDSGPMQKSTRRRRRSSPSLTFVEMTGLRGDALEVVLPTSVRICVRPEFDADTLTRLLDVLEGRR